MGFLRRLWRCFWRLDQSDTLPMTKERREMLIGYDRKEKERR